MSVSNTVRALPGLIKVSIAESIAYRAEIFIWIFTTTMPFIMLALWRAVASEAPMGRLGPREFTAYFLGMFIVRMLTSSWIAWELNFQVRQGTLSFRLLRPVETLWHMAIENLSALPLRAIVLAPIIVLGWNTAGRAMWPSNFEMWAIWFASVMGGWLITCLVNTIIGAFSLTSDSTLKLMDFWLAMYFVLSGYTVPLELFPERVKPIVDALPFRYQVGLGVEIMTHAHTSTRAWQLLSVQWLYVLVLWSLAWLTWRRGLRNYGAFGG